jgi:hypothetical protein
MSKNSYREIFSARVKDMLAHVLFWAVCLAGAPLAAQAQQLTTTLDVPNSGVLTVGANTTVTVTMTNNSGVDTTGGTLTMALPATGALYLVDLGTLPASWDCTVTGALPTATGFTCDALPAVADGDSASATFTIRAPGALLSQVIFGAQTSATPFALFSNANNQASAVVSTSATASACSPDMVGAWAASPTVLTQGQPSTYQLTVTNQGGCVAVNGGTVTITVPAGTTVDGDVVTDTTLGCTVVQPSPTDDGSITCPVGLAGGPFASVQTIFPPCAGPGPCVVGLVSLVLPPGYSQTLSFTLTPDEPIASAKILAGISGVTGYSAVGAGVTLMSSFVLPALDPELNTANNNLSSITITTFSTTGPAAAVPTLGHLMLALLALLLMIAAVIGMRRGAR